MDWRGSAKHADFGGLRQAGGAGRVGGWRGGDFGAGGAGHRGLGGLRQARTQGGARGGERGGGAQTVQNSATRKTDLPQ